MPHPLSYPAGRHVPARELEEVKFWLEVMLEHALVIKNGLPVMHADLISEADDYYRRFGELLKRANTVNGEKKYKALVDDSLNQVRKFYRFNRRLLRMALTGKLGGALFPLMLDHMSREALYAICVLERLCDDKTTYYKASMVREMLFWLRIMSDHTKLISHLLDPSEAGLIAVADDFSAEFDALYLQARDFASMLGAQGDIPAFDRFILDVRAAVTRLRDFKRALYVMLQEGRVLGLMPALLADHMREEAEHFLMVLSLMEKGLIECAADETSVDLIQEEVLVDEEVAALTADITFSPLFGSLAPQYGNDAIEECEPGVVEAAAEEALEAAEAEEAEEDDEPEECIPEPPKSVPGSKFKWSGKWPRPLGKFSD